MYTVELIDLSAYAENVVLVSNAPVYDRVECATFEDAFAVVMEFGDEFQCNIIYPTCSAPDHHIVYNGKE